MQEKIYFSKLEEYSQNEVEAIRKIYEFVGVSAGGRNDPAKSKLANSIRNKGYSTKPVWDKTRELLNDFYRPFNRELAKLLGDDKWLWL